MHIDDEVTPRTAKASVAFGGLHTNVWERNHIRLNTKLKVYKAVVLSTLLYTCVTWAVYQRHAKRLNRFHLSCLRKLLKIGWKDKIPDTKVLKKAKMQSIHTLLKLAQLMLQECLMSGCQRKFSMENCRKESAHKVVKTNAKKTPLKPRLRISIFQLSPGNRLRRIEQNGVASSTKKPHNLLNQRESVKLKGSVKKGKQEPRDHHQTSLVMRKPDFCICENKDADQLRGNREADQRLCFRYTDSTIPLLHTSKILASSHLLWLYRPVCVGPGQKPRRPVFSERGSD